MMYTKPEMEIEKFDIAEVITADGSGEGQLNTSSAAVKEGGVGSDLVIG